jgi:hypothetical protein
MMGKDSGRQVVEAETWRGIQLPRHQVHNATIITTREMMSIPASVLLLVTSVCLLEFVRITKTAKLRRDIHS